MKKRLKYLVYPEIQVPLIMVNIVANLFFFSLALSRIDNFFKMLKDLGARSGVTDPYFQFLDAQKKNINLELTFVLIFSMAISTIVMLWLSHRLAGPLKRIESQLKKMSESGKGELIVLREKDYFKNMSVYLNSIINRSNNK